MKIERRLAEGIGGWLIFEQHCNKSGLFTERYLSFPIGQILSSIYGSNVHSEFIHPIISKYSTGRGAKPKVDFAVLNDDREPILAIETKWIGQSIPSVQSILWDLVRLESLASEYGTSCIFLIGGKKKKLQSLFNSSEFKMKKSARPNPILSTQSLGLKTLSIVSNDPGHLSTWRPLTKKWQNMPFPSKIGTQLFKPFPADCTLEQYQVYGWRIYKADNKTTFVPKNTKIYRG
ncbi:MAG TPA: hypothetical protein PKW08_13190 [Flavobacteriaceae bacterium]|nr:hypothetical protein [Flavobacteriaceae bacterium]MCB9213262.1 hypothetical protein [Alteromonas sp.]HQU22537.1 hypothetical protein [Flavobacteriaceae bacterium]HQU66238.1 hypothetical protein [Flavobacteriaceae bacterium]HRW45809.1 hypothetical protein [Flavobacteriaceae bacterium]